jgi:hypothetical protein
MYVQFEVLTVVLLRIQALLDVILCSVSGSQHFEGSTILPHVMTHSPGTESHPRRTEFLIMIAYKLMERLT